MGRVIFNLEIGGFIMYIDPGTGGQLFQILAIAFASLSGAVLLFGSRIKLWFAKMRRKMREGGETEVETIEPAE